MAKKKDLVSIPYKVSFMNHNWGVDFEKGDLHTREFYISEVDGLKRVRVTVEVVGDEPRKIYSPEDTNKVHMICDSDTNVDHLYKFIINNLSFNKVMSLYYLLHHKMTFGVELRCDEEVCEDD